MSGASLNQLELDAAILQAKIDGFEVVRADDTHLLLDLDNEQALAQFDRVLPVVMEHFGATDIERWRSKSGNTHIRLRIASPQPWAVRYALQTALGSDGVRDVLAIVQMLNGCDEAAMLFRPQQLKAAA